MRAGVAITFILLVLLIGCKSPKPQPSNPLFASLDSVNTHVDFVNQLDSRKGKMSIVDYLYYYNGGGVAAGDINNDGLTDLYFVSNSGPNKLYLNKGNMTFEDITDSAGVAGRSEWQTGVTMADVNGDGYLDIYVCAVADYMGLEGENELYINNHDGTFTESAGPYGLNFSGFSTQAAFFDYDHDGDLDMYLLNHAVHNSRSYDRVIARKLPDRAAGDYLYRNDGGKFTDVSKQAGIYQAAMGYGLGITVADMNNDGWEDIYVTNDFHEDDYYYVNNHDGTFTEEGKAAFRHFSRFSMGCDVADINNDGYQDVITLDMSPEDETIQKLSAGEDPWDIFIYKLSYGYYYQFSRNCLQLSNGAQNFSDWALLSGVASTDWSWAPLIADYNNDGYPDLFITNGISRRPTDLDYIKFAHQDSMLYATQLTYHQIDRAIKMMPEGKVHNYLYEGTPDSKFINKSVAWGMGEPSLSNGAAYADLDNDGDLDLICNNVNAPAGIYENLTNSQSKANYLEVSLVGDNKNTAGIGTKVFLKTSKGFQMRQMMPTRGFLSSVDDRLYFGLGTLMQVDSLIVLWNDGRSQVLTHVNANQVYRLEQKNAVLQSVRMGLYKEKSQLLQDKTASYPIDYIHQENNYLDFNRESLQPFLVSIEGPKIAVGDVNGDGQEDFFVGGAKHQPGSLFIQRQGKFELQPQPSFRKDSVFEDVDATFFDADHDGDLDLYVVSGGNEFYGKMPQQFDRLYFNDGKGHFTRDETALPPMYENKSCVRTGDFDKDGDLDLFVGGRVVGYGYGQTPRSYLLVNDGKGHFSDETDKLAPGLSQVGMVADAAWEDFDSDGDLDLVVAGDWMPIRFFENNGGHFKEVQNIIPDSASVKNINGLWQCIGVADFDGDGDPDLIVGNLGQNTRLRMDGDSSVLKMYVGDFDDNGQNDQIVVYNRPNGKFYTLATKDELSKQLPTLFAKNYTSYKSFAGQSIDEIFQKIQIQPPAPLIVNQFSTIYLENLGHWKFRPVVLPNEAQLSKVFTFLIDDFDNDGNKDVLVAGNYFGGTTYQGTYDANYGTVLKGDGHGNFSVVPPLEAGVILNGQTRDIKPIQTPGGQVYLITKNGAGIQVIQKAEHYPIGKRRSM